MRYVRTAAPEAPLVALHEASAYIRILSNAENALIEGFCAAAEQHLDARTGIVGRALVEQTWRLETCGPDCHGRIRLGLPPVIAVESAAYLVDGVSTPWAAENWRLGGDEICPFVVPLPGVSWPAADARDDAWRITFRAGYGEPKDVPRPLWAAALMLVAHLYAHREATTADALAETPLGVTALVAPFRVIHI